MIDNNSITVVRIKWKAHSSSTIGYHVTVPAFFMHYYLLYYIILMVYWYRLLYWVIQLWDRIPFKELRSIIITIIMYRMVCNNDYAWPWKVFFTHFSKVKEKSRAISDNLYSRFWTFHVRSHCVDRYYIMYKRCFMQLCSPTINTQCIYRAIIANDITTGGGLFHDGD